MFLKVRADENHTEKEKIHSFHDAGTRALNRASHTGGAPKNVG